tara:strand:- start:3111 stop:3746 length:636 start_codon:yes stop_codon:yes gene_type:complete
MLSDPALLTGFILTITAIVVSPGPDNMLIIRNALISGRAVGMATVAGVQTGIVGHTLLAALGVSVVIASSPTLFRAVAVCGAAYLGWLGLRAFRASGDLTMGRSGHVTALSGFRDATITNLLNPKVIITFLAMFPNFLDVSAGNIPLQLTIMALLMLVINGLWQIILVLAADRARQWLTRPEVQRGINYVTGTVFIAFACLMLWEHLLSAT